MKRIHAPHPEGTSLLSTQELRGAFLIDSLFQPGALETVYWDADRTIIGSAVPAAKPIVLEAPREDLAAEYFLERRELGILNIGGSGSVDVDRTSFPMRKLDCLYVGRGAQPGDSRPHSSRPLGNPRGPRRASSIPVQQGGWIHPRNRAHR